MIGRILSTVNVLSLGLASSLVMTVAPHSMATQSINPQVSEDGALTNIRLWARSRFTKAARRRAIIRGLRFIYRNALNPRNFEEYGSDYLWCFYTISASVNDPMVRSTAQQMGVERARHWRELHAQLPVDVNAASLADFVFGSDAADSLGVSDAGIKQQIQKAVLRFRATDLLPFDPAKEPPPSDVPEACAFDNTLSPRGSRTCLRCGRKLRMRSRYDVWCEALVTVYSGEHFGLKLGADYRDVIKWLPTLRPYPRPGGGVDKDFIDSVYAVTHVVYTLNDYDQCSLPADVLSDEYQFLKANLLVAIARHNQDMLGEFIDSLKSLGLTEDDAAMRRGIDYLLTHQNRDGSWGNRSARDNYDRYHPTWNGIAALSNYNWCENGSDPVRLQFVRELRTGSLSK